MLNGPSSAWIYADFNWKTDLLESFHFWTWNMCFQIKTVHPVIKIYGIRGSNGAI